VGSDHNKNQMATADQPIDDDDLYMQVDQSNNLPWQELRTMPVQSFEAEDTSHALSDCHGVLRTEFLEGNVPVRRKAMDLRIIMDGNTYDQDDIDCRNDNSAVGGDISYSDKGAHTRGGHTTHSKEKNTSKDNRFDQDKPPMVPLMRLPCL
jgi:hypothetical protein